jgi:anaphase-promoting complex subunit 6
MFSMDDDALEALEDRAREITVRRGEELHPLAVLLSVEGKAYYYCDNRIKSVRALKYSLHIDVYCTESCLFMCGNGLISRVEMRQIFSSLAFAPEEDWLSEYYRFVLGVENAGAESGAGGIESSPPVVLANSTDVKLRLALEAYEKHDSEVAYRIIRQVYSEDPYGCLCVCIYVATMVDLGLKTDLFFLAHEMVHAYPRRSVSWYAVGCYYLCVKKYEQAQRYFQKATKLDRRWNSLFVSKV